MKILPQDSRFCATQNSTVQPQPTPTTANVDLKRIAEMVRAALEILAEHEKRVQNAVAEVSR